MKYSVIVPVYNEEEVLPETCRRLRRVMETTGESFELIFVDDGSRDSSVAILQEIGKQDPAVKVVVFSRNFGQQAAISAGLAAASGEAMVIIDADLQDPPEVIPKMIAKWKEGYQVVYGKRSERKGETWFKKFTAAAFYRLMNRLTECEIPMDTGDFRLMDRKVVDALQSMREHNRFIRGLTSWIGFKQTGISYVRQARHSGETKYPLRKMVRFAMDAITGFSYFPLQIMIYVSFVLGVLAVLAIPVVSILRVVLGSGFMGGQATTIVLLLTIGAFQLFFLFIMGQYIARIYDEVRDRPLYIVASAKGFNTQPTTEKSPEPQPEMES